MNKCRWQSPKQRLYIFSLLEHYHQTDLPMQSVPITTQVVSSYSVHGDAYSIQHYVMKVCRWLPTGFLWVLPFSSTNKTARHNITEILLKLVLNTINQAKTIDRLQSLSSLWQVSLPFQKWPIRIHADHWVAPKHLIIWLSNILDWSIHDVRWRLL